MAFLFLLGFLFSAITIFILLSRTKEMGRLGLTIVSVSLSLLLIGIIALSLTLLGIYRLETVNYVLLLFAAIGLGIFVKRRRQDRSKFPAFELGKFELLFVVFFSIFTLYLYAGFPTQNIDGGRDQGQYAVFGYVIAKTGALNLDMPDSKLIRDIFGDSVSMEFRSVGLGEGDRRFPAFFYLLPAYLAIGYDLFNMEGLLRVPAFFGFLSFFLFYLISRKMIGRVGAGMVSVLYVFNSSQLWNVRSILSEPISQFLILLSGYLVYSCFRKKSDLPMLCIGAVFGLSSFVRVDGYAYFPALALFSAYILLVKPIYFRKFLFFFCSFAVVNLLSMVIGYFHYRYYIMEHWKFVKLLLIGFILSSGGVFFEAILWSRESRLLVRIRDGLKKYKFYVRIVFLSFLIALAIFGYFVRPAFGIVNDPSNHEYLENNAFTVFSWYVPAWLTFFLVFAFDSFLFRGRHFRSAFLFFIGSFILLLYLLKPNIASDHFWATRRWMIFSVPFAILGSFVGIREIPFISRKVRSALLLIGFVCGLGYTLWRSKILLFQPMMEFYRKGYEDFARVMPGDDGYYFTTKHEIALPLRYIYGRKIFLLNDSVKFLEKVPQLLKSGKKVYLIQNGEFAGSDPGLKFEKISELNLRGHFPVESIQKYPEFLYHKNLNLQLFRVEAASGSYSPKPIEMEWVPAEGGFISRTGEIEKDGTITATRHRGPLVYGPWLTLPRGKYELRILGRNLQNAEFDVAYGKGNFLLAERQKGTESDSMTLYFEVKDSIIDDLEFRAFVEGKSGVKVERISVKNILKK
ncbi:hypothetical protein EHQ27_18745 [Leptospira wolffii]|uniref:hypothetical protein n=1 Tax=Leptospira wolffii TaxID=409998 RepID=UPI001083D500|nr:hypothetical protein [Leptospira wolffii]TGK62591.1 hypothetical protein EHQ32_07185 [Leptospira wolffii]TGK65566.1 hypothetical protein EHQ27_18745 [Leptospira wolffii]TGK74024.1 hypothetical protein EHQ35_06585 [Leptospira wolffii]TGL28883.1 hypothetical protein EHQ57_13105 [Leptospira wolffii]